MGADTEGERVLPKHVLVTGASGFVGRHLRYALDGAGFSYSLASRRPSANEDPHTRGLWRYLDLEKDESLDGALEGCDAVVHLVHQMDGRPDYPAREARASEMLARACDRNGVERLVFLGGPDPGPEGSKHLRSRIRAGQVLRESFDGAVELRAAMILGHGSAGWRMVRRLAERLPAMVLPRWASNHSWPVGIEDAVSAVLVALTRPRSGSEVFDLPGPVRVRHVDVLRQTAALIGKRPPMVPVPVLSPRLSSYWIALITGVDLHLTKQLVDGVVRDLDPTVESIWASAERCSPSLEQSLRWALADDVQDGLTEDRRAQLRALGSAYAERPV